MRALEMIRQWFEEELSPELEKAFPELTARIAAGLAGRGSECFGYDDEISRDHDYHLSLWLWVTAEDEARYGFALQRFYNDLWKKSALNQIETSESLLGGSVRGVCVIEDFFRRHLGIENAPENIHQWFNIPEYAFAEAVNGEVFRDESRAFSSIRDKIANGMPEDVRLKKLAARAAMMAQCGQYNYLRCIKHNEMAAAQLALDEFVRNALSLIHLLNFRFAPYYKWAFRSLRDLPLLGGQEAALQRLLCGNLTVQERAEAVENTAGCIIKVLQDQGISSSNSDYLEDHAVEIMKHIKSREIRAMHLMEG